MKESFINKIKTILEEEKNALLGKRHQDLDIDLSGDEVDAIQGKILANVQNQLNSRNQAKLKNIESAHERIKEGTFGLCEECGEQIAEKRLLINPMFLTCISCAEKLEFQAKNHRKS